MKFSLAALASLVAAATAASLPSSFTLVTPGGAQLVTDGSNVYQADSATTDQAVLILSSSGDVLNYLAEDAATPTAFQTLYAFSDGSQPLGLTVPHSGNVPSGAKTTGWGVNDDGYLTFAGNDAFGKDSSGKIAAGTGELTLWVKEYKS